MHGGLNEPLAKVVHILLSTNVVLISHASRWVSGVHVDTQEVASHNAKVTCKYTTVTTHGQVHT